MCKTGPGSRMNSALPEVRAEMGLARTRALIPVVDVLCEVVGVGSGGISPYEGFCCEIKMVLPHVFLQEQIIMM